MAVYESPGPGRVLIAVGAGPLVAEPTWTRYDNLGSACGCAGFDWSRGRQSEFDVTEAGTARVYFHDRSQTMNDESFVGLQIMLQLHDPVAGVWQPVFRGLIDRVGLEPSPGAPSLANVELGCVGIFSYLASVKMIPGVFGDPIPSNYPNLVGSVFYEDGPAATGTNDPDDGGRVEHLLYDAGLANTMYVAFSLNVDVNETLYDPNDSILEGVRQAVDADFPGVANAYEDRFGRVAVHGRLSRFDPDGTAAGASTGAWDFTRWAAATREDVTTGVAQIREFSYSIPADRIINAYLAWPGDDHLGYPFKQKNVAALQRTDATSISEYGYRSVEKANLIIKAHKTNGNTGAEECGLIGDYYIANYAQPKITIERVTFRSMRPGDARAEDNWALITGMDISDIIALTVDEAGLAAEEYFIEGIEGSARPSYHDDWDIVEVTPNLSPVAYFGTDVFS